MVFMIYESMRDASSVFVEMQKRDDATLIQIQVKLYEGSIGAKLEADAFYEPLATFLDMRPGLSKPLENELYRFINEQKYPMTLPERHVKRALPSLPVRGAVPSPNPAPFPTPALPAPVSAISQARQLDLAALQNLIFPQAVKDKKGKYVDPDVHHINKTFVKNSKQLVFGVFMDDPLFKQSFDELAQGRENIRQEFSNFLKQDHRYQGNVHYKTAIDNIFGGYWNQNTENKETGGVSLQNMMLMIYAVLKRRATFEYCALTETQAYGFLMLQLEDQSKTCFQGSIGRMFSVLALSLREFYARRG